LIFPKQQMLFHLLFLLGAILLQKQWLLLLFLVVPFIGWSSGDVADADTDAEPETGGVMMAPYCPLRTSS
jgi:hypothetical protein